MKRIPVILFFLASICSCDNGYLQSDPVEELVVEGWIESGHAPTVFVSATFPVSSKPQSIDSLSDHILRYAEVFIDCEQTRYYLTARLSDKYVLQNYFTSSSLRGEVGKTYRLGVKWQDYEASAVCTIPPPTSIDTLWIEKQENDTSFVAKIQFTNNPEENRYYQSFMRNGVSDENVFRAVNFTCLDGSLMEDKVTETFMKPMLINTGVENPKDLYFHKGDCAAVKLATTQKCIYEFWSSYTNLYNSYSILTAPINLKGNVEGAIGYWAGYGISMREFTVE